MNSTADWYQWVDRTDLNFDFKSGAFFHFEAPENFKQLGRFFHEIMPVSPKDRTTVQCPLGNLQRRSLILDAYLLYAMPENMIRQGDLIEFETPCDRFAGLKTKHAVVAAHTCDVQNKTYCQIIPAYFKAEFLELEKETGDKAKGAFENAKNNQIIHLMPYPPADEANQEVIIADFRQMTTISKSEIKQAKILNSLSLQGTFYFQNRLALCHVRDLKDRDDRRVLKK